MPSTIECPCCGEQLDVHEVPMMARYGYSVVVLTWGGDWTDQCYGCEAPMFESDIRAAQAAAWAEEEVPALAA